MASTYSSNLKLQLMATGENTGTWGNVTNVNLGTALEEAIVGSIDVTFASADVTLSLTNTNATQTARNMRLVLVGTSGGARQLVVPAIEKIYIVKNELADTCTVKVSGQTGVAVPAGKTMWLCNDGTDVKDVVTHLSSLTLGSALPAASGGTGITSPGTAGNVLVSSGSAWASQALTTFSTGMIMLWSGSTGTIPSGWQICDGTNGTPDLRNRFVVGAGSTYAVGATGGSADAIVVSHTHTATVTDPGHSHTVPYTANLGGSTGGSGVNATGGPTSTSSVTTGITVGISTTGSSGTNANLPPYYALAYIMKL